jgi:chemotaxis protein MotB
MARSRRRHQEEEAHGNHERWLVSYADMMTLLMVLFIVMFAISQVDQRRFDMLKDGMAAGFGATTSPFEGTEGLMADQGVSPLSPMAPEAAPAPPQAVQVRSASASSGSAGSARGAGTASTSSTDTDLAQARAEVDRLTEIKRRIERALRARGYLQDVAFRIDERGLSISLISRHIVFRANEAHLSPRGMGLLQVLAPVIRSLPNRIDVDGHTNQVKVKPKFYPTDWELSAARAVTVLRYLDETAGVPASRLAAVAYGHEKPLRDPSLPGAAALNKRVDLVVVSAASEAARKLFPKVLRDQTRS